MKLELRGMAWANGAAPRSVEVSSVPGLTVPWSMGKTLQVVAGTDGDTVVVGLLYPDASVSGLLYPDGGTRYFGCLASDGACVVGEWPNETDAGMDDSDVIQAAARHVSG